MAPTPTNPIFPANREQLNALSTVLEITCVDAKKAYEDVKSTRPPPRVSLDAGLPYRKCSLDTLFGVVGGCCPASTLVARVARGEGQGATIITSQP